MGVLKGGRRQQDADKENNRRHIDLLQGVNQGQRLLFIRFLVSMDEFADQPENAQPEKYSHKRWQVSNGLEGWHWPSPK
jgi:hypothetical protein